MQLWQNLYDGKMSEIHIHKGSDINEKFVININRRCSNRTTEEEFQADADALVKMLDDSLPRRTHELMLDRLMRQEVGISYQEVLKLNDPTIEPNDESI